MKIKEGFLSACAVAALLAGTAACTSGTDERSAAATAALNAACKNGRYEWFNVDKRDVLTSVAEKETLGKGGGALTNRPMALHTPRVAVTFDKGTRAGAAQSKAALLSLGARIGETEKLEGIEYEFANVNRPSPVPDKNHTEVLGAGTFVDYTWVEQVTADFRYTCGTDRPVAGRATSWTIDGSGVLECSESIAEASERDPVRQAAVLSCGPDAPASKA
ncbi:hypothetical protein AQF52_4661 [Streptomyces venezuelae]|uniref:hypothetical protein n=1 Tax=Streptomyces gardneri TaxID=66892 RepID=UPI0006BC7204|nr:hypothetical protein [Streptomyces gardneri]ALO10255.1 hypothetical protein AQF52_4661 [Streptomyces venezuelae]QPK47276.1 hypothetical protein H4W23_23380 [Streptomyces gardneri]WRK38699.1 hypothetical protein U0M97_23480 [Streptomyces venezuelae]CUM39290.1 hypothetical protein BN2537_7545 [Streptomyces venezuelae]